MNNFEKTEFEFEVKLYERDILLDLKLVIDD